ncbi:MAG: methyltransferase domain-containing protein [Ramlibacter sp.]|uniref:class I SAM-dependent methyltransferase n=1 Tax=Ramlibacter sp. TaxID=1917967 RepID=UPI00261C7CA5|nr:class I SAM-dependent methyltransferase [Ramlibacter sp.]MDH4377717.1 methyltransferase domain-containing protein [Ramlibacter sp.]
MLEDSYGIAKRIEFVAGILGSSRPARVLDIGCGTGSNLTVPLARRFPETNFLGVDSDRTSIDYANQEYSANNLSFRVREDVEDLGQFDLIIASEVIEHVEAPDDFLVFLRSHLAPGGRLVVTLPNGWGPFELTSLFETLLHLSGLYAILRALKRRLRGNPLVNVTVDTLAISPHINFFSHGEINNLFARQGFRVAGYRPRTLLCGFGFDQLMASQRVILWNSRWVDRLPPPLASAWMFLLSPEDNPTAQLPPPFRRGLYARLRRYLNEKRWHLR